MKRHVGLAFGVWMLAVSAASADTMKAASQIVAVSVFPDRAGITRAAPLTLHEGPQSVELAPLPSHIEPDSVTAKGSGEAQVTLYSVRLVTRQLEAAADPKVKMIEEDIQHTTQHQQQLRNTKQVLEQEREYLNSIQAASSEQIGKDLVTKSPSATDAASLLAFLDDALLKNAQRDQEADEELLALSRQLDKLRRELADLTQNQAKQETAIIVDLDVQKSGAFQLEVSYRLPGATWQPSYEARATTAADDVELGLSGLVRQQTGEDWADVQLTLSTAKPAIAGSMPELQPWFLRPWEGVYAKAASVMMAERTTAPQQLREEDKKEFNAPEKSEAQIAYATVAAQGPAVTFTLPRHSSIPGDWQPHKVPIAASRLKANLAYETTPRLLPYAFLRAKMVNTTDTLYLAGPVSVFLDGAFVATGALKQVEPNEEFDLYLGVDERVKVERKQLKERVEVSLLPGLRGKTKSTDYAFLTTIENFTGRRIAVTAFDQVPVSEREEIIVESIKQTPPEVEKDSEKPGVFRWTLNLSPNQKQELKLSYRVRHPVEMQVQ